MRRASILPIAVMAFAIVGFLFVLDYSVSGGKWPWSTGTHKKIAVTNSACSGEPIACADGSLVWRSGPSCDYSACPNEQTNAATTNTSTKTTTNINATTATVATQTNTNATTYHDPTAKWKTYTNTKYGFSFKYPPDWTVTENQVTVGTQHVDGVQLMSADGNDGFAVTAVPFYLGQTDPVEQFSQYTTLPAASTAQTTVIAGINGMVFTYHEQKPTISAFIDHAGIAFKLDQITDQTTFSLITHSFSFTDGDVDLEPSNPIKTVTNVSGIVPFSPSRISIMGDKALLGSFFGTTTNGSLYEYDGHQAIDITSNITASDPVDANRTYGVNSIANNGKYWLVSVCRYQGGNYLFKYDGTTWTNLTSYVRTAQNRSGCFGPSMTWNGTDWLFTYNLQLIKYDGDVTFTNVPLSSEFSQQFIVFGATWNGSYYLIPTNGSVWKTFKYDGQTFEALPIPPDNHVTSAAWNGSYWLLSGVSKQPILKYDGATITTYPDVTAQQSGGTWVKSIWLVGPYFFDGTKLDVTTPFTVSFRVDATSLGDHYGLLSGGGRIWKFTF